MGKIVHIMDEKEYDDVCKTEDPVAVLKYLCDKEEDVSGTKTLRISCWRTKWIWEKISEIVEAEKRQTVDTYLAYMTRGSFTDDPDDVETWLEDDLEIVTNLITKLSERKLR